MFRPHEPFKLSYPDLMGNRFEGTCAIVLISFGHLNGCENR